MLKYLHYRGAMLVVLSLENIIWKMLLCNKVENTKQHSERKMKDMDYFKIVCSQL